MKAELEWYLRRPNEWWRLGQRRWALALRGNRRVSRKTVKTSTAKFARFSRRTLGGATPFRCGPSWRREVSSVLSRWHSGECSHLEATSSLERLAMAAMKAKPSWEHLATASQLAQSVGLFNAGQKFLAASWSVMDKTPASNQSIHFRVARMKHALYRGQLVEASQLYEDLCISDLPPSLMQALGPIGWYLQTCKAGGARKAFRVTEFPVSNLWHDSIRNRDVLIVGPGQTVDLPLIESGFLVARILGPGVWEWSDPQDIVSNVTDAVYCIPEVIERERKSRNEAFFTTLESYRFVSVKKTNILGTPNSRQVDTFSSLFSSGHPQMVPLAVLDVLAHSGRPVVVGSDFFQSATAYRDSDRRKPGLKTQEVSGSDGGDFDRTALMASHNIFENWAIVKNLADAGQVRGDQGFMRALDCGPEELFSRYDEVLGQRRI